MDIVTMASVIEWTKRRKKMLIVGMTVTALVGGVVQQTYAVYQVHDSKVYAQIVEQIKRAQEQIAQLKAQYDLQLKNMQDLKKEHLDPILKDIGVMKNEYEKTRNGMDDIWKTTTKVPEVFKKTFEDLKNINISAISYTELGSKVEMNRQQLEKLNKEVIVLISKKQAELDQSNKRIAEMTALIPTTKGEKAIADLQAHIAAENVRAGNIASEIQALQTKQNAMKAQFERLEKEASVKMNQKVADDFKKAGEDLQAAADQSATMKPASDAASQAAAGMGW